MYALAIRNNVYIIDLEQTIPMIRRAIFLVLRTSNQRGKIYFVPRPSLSARGSQIFSGGTPDQIGTGPVGQKQQFIPEAMCLPSSKHNLPVLRTAIALAIPTIAIVNGGTDVMGINIPIPANDVLFEKSIYKKLMLNAATGFQRNDAFRLY